MGEQFSHIATITLSHAYFKNRLAKSINFSIEDRTCELMKNLGILLKPFSGGVYLLSSRPDLLASDHLEDALQINFDCLDPNYINYTDLGPFQPTLNILYFNNLNAQNTIEKNTHALHINTYVNASDIVQINHGNMQIPKFDAYKDYIFKMASGEILPAETLLNSQNNSGIINISKAPEGLIQVFSENQKVFETYHHSKSIWKKPLGIIELYTQKLFEDYNNNQKVNYNISFNTRETYWKYFLTGDVYKKFDALSIINKEKKSIFKAPQKHQIGNSPPIIVFETKDKLPLLEYSENTLQLVNNYNADSRTGKVIIKNLPLPDPDQLFIEKPASRDTFYSHIYIN